VVELREARREFMKENVGERKDQPLNRFSKRKSQRVEMKRRRVFIVIGENTQKGMSARGAEEIKRND